MQGAADKTKTSTPTRVVMKHDQIVRSERKREADKTSSSGSNNKPTKGEKIEEGTIRPTSAKKQ